MIVGLGDSTGDLRFVAAAHSQPLYGIVVGMYVFLGNSPHPFVEGTNIASLVIGGVRTDDLDRPCRNESMTQY